MSCIGEAPMSSSSRTTPAAVLLSFSSFFFARHRLPLLVVTSPWTFLDCQFENRWWAGGRWAPPPPPLLLLVIITAFLLALTEETASGYSACHRQNLFRPSIPSSSSSSSALRRYLSSVSSSLLFLSRRKWLPVCDPDWPLSTDGARLWLTFSDLEDLVPLLSSSYIPFDDTHKALWMLLDWQEEKKKKKT